VSRSKRLLGIAGVLVLAIAIGWAVSRRGSVRGGSEASNAAAGPPALRQDGADALDPGTVSRSGTRIEAEQTRPAESERPVVAAGLVLDAEGRPFGDASIEAGRPGFEPIFDSQPDSPWADIPILRTRTDASGRFELEGTSPLPSIELRATHADGVDAASITVDAGSHAVRLVLARGGSIRGRVQLDAGVAARGLGIQALRSGETAGPSVLWTLDGGTVGHGGSSVGPDADLGFEFRGLLPGSYTLRAFLEHGWEPVFDVSAIVVRSGEATLDPRLDPMDLRGLLRSFEIRVADETGQPVSIGMAAWVSKPGTSTARKVAFTDARFFILSAAPSVDLEVGATGFRTTRLSAVDGPREVILRMGITVRIRMRGAFVPDPPARLRVALAPEIGEGRAKPGLEPGAGLALNLEGMEPALLEKLRAFNDCSWFDGVDLDADGAAVLEVAGPGRYQVHWYTASPPGPDGMVQVGQLLVDPPQWIDVREQVGDVGLDLTLDPNVPLSTQSPR